MKLGCGANENFEIFSFKDDRKIPMSYEFERSQSKPTSEKLLNIKEFNLWEKSSKLKKFLISEKSILTTLYRSVSFQSLSIAKPLNSFNPFLKRESNVEMSNDLQNEVDGLKRIFVSHLLRNKRVRFYLHIFDQHLLKLRNPRSQVVTFFLHLTSSPIPPS